MCGTTEMCPTPEVGQTQAALSLTLGLPRVYHLCGPGLHVKVRAPPFGSWNVEVRSWTSNLQPLTSSIPEGALVAPAGLRQAHPRPQPRDCALLAGLPRPRALAPLLRLLPALLLLPPPLLPAVLRLGRGVAAGERPRQSLLLRHPAPRLPPRLGQGDALRYRPPRARRGAPPLHPT